MVDSEPEMLLNNVYGRLGTRIVEPCLLLVQSLAVQSLLFSHHDGASTKMGLDVV
jgi:hypothetical protein